MNTPQPQPRRPRRDVGAVRLGARDLFALRIVAEHWAVRTSLLAEVLTAYGRQQLTGELDELFDDGRVSADAARKVVSRWQRAGLVDDAPILARGVHCWATARGLRAVGLEQYRPASPAAVMLPHHDAVLATRIWLEALPEGRWVSERGLRSLLPARTGGSTVPHLPDGEMLTPHGREAIEVELHSKGTTRTLRNVRALLTRTHGWTADTRAEPGSPPRYTRVRYVAKPEAARTLERVREQLTSAENARLLVEVMP